MHRYKCKRNKYAKRIKNKNDEFLQRDIRSKSHNANRKRLVNKPFYVFGCVCTMTEQC